MNRGKKLLLVLVLIVAVGSVFVPKAVDKMVLPVKVTKMTHYDYVSYVAASGEIEQKNKLQIKSDYPAIISEVLINVGDTIKKGQPIAKIDREVTAQKIMEGSSYAQVAGLSGSDILSSYQDAYSKIPAQLYSTMDGVVETVNIKTGEYIEKDGVVASLLSTGELVLNVKVSEDKVANIEVGQPVEISGSGFESGKYYGYVKTISPSARKAYVGTNQETVVDVVASIENCDNKIKSGYSAEAKIITDPVKKIYILPYGAISQDDKGQQYVYVFSKGFAIRRNVTTGLELSDGIEVITGLNKDDIVIVDAQGIKRSGTLVKVVE